VFGNGSAKLVVVEVVLACELVGGALYEAKLVGGDVERGEDGANEVFVVFCAVRNKFQGGLEVVEEGVNI
jgi:hypothetical protein